MRIVVNHLTFAEPIPPSVLEAAAEAGRRATAAGGLGLDLVQVDEVTAFLVLRFPDLETERRITEEIGGPLMRERVRPHLAGGTDRRSGEVVVSAAPEPTIAMIAAPPTTPRFAGSSPSRRGDSNPRPHHYEG